MKSMSTIETFEQLLAAAERDPRVIATAPEALFSPANCEALVKKSPYFISFVPMHFVTPALERVAVETDGRALAFIRSIYPFPTELYLQAIRTYNPEFSGLLQYIPFDVRTAELCLEAVRRRGSDIVHVPKSLLTLEIFLTAAKSTAAIFSYMPNEIKASHGVEIFEAALDGQPQMIGELLKAAGDLDQSRVKKACIKALSKDPLLLREIPYKLRAPEFCAAAATVRGAALELTPVEHRDNLALCMLAVTNPVAGEKSPLASVPDAMRTSDLCVAACEADGLALEFVPGELKGLDLCALAIAQNPAAVKFVPQEILLAGFQLYRETTAENVVRERG